MIAPVRTALLAALVLSAVLTVFLLAAPAAKAQTVTFEGFAPAGGSTALTPTSPYTEAGLTFTATTAGAAIFDSASPTTLAGDTTDFLGFTRTTAITVTQTGGGLFSVRSFYSGPITPGTGSSMVSLVGYRNGALVGSVNISASSGIMFGFTGPLENVDTVTLTGTAGSGIDNLQFVGTAVYAVPEPSEYAVGGMFGATLLLGMVKARRKSGQSRTGKKAVVGG